MSEDELVHADFDAAFEDGAELVDEDGVPMRVRVVPLGAIPITSGALGVGDAFTGCSRITPAGKSVPSGHHRVDVSLLRFEADGTLTQGDERIAVARIRFSDSPVVRWARSDAGAGVDSGTCAFIDGETTEWTEEESDALLEAIEDANIGLSASAIRFALPDGRVTCAFSSGAATASTTAGGGSTKQGIQLLFASISSSSRSRSRWTSPSPFPSRAVGSSIRALPPRRSTRA